jgi:outer membrane protein TolC
MKCFNHKTLRVTAGLGLAVLAGCTTPLSDESERLLHRTILESVRREAAEAERLAEPRLTEREPGIDRLGLKPEVMAELETMAGLDSYDATEMPLSEDLLGRPQDVLAVSLERVVRTAVEHNLAVQFARLDPAINQAQVTAAEAAFDWTLFSNLNWNNTDEPRTSQLSFGSFTTRQTNTLEWDTGIRKLLSTGGQLTIQQGLTRTDERTPGLTTTPNPSLGANVTLQLDQPLLRNFGSDVALAQVRLNRNAERDVVAQLKADLLQTVTDTEQAYWSLVEAHRNLLILQRLLERGVTVREQVRARRGLDATQAQIADAVARVEARKANVLRAQNAVRQASDRLKLLMNDPAVPLGSEQLLVPVDMPVDEPVYFSLYDAIMTAAENRPEVQQALISLDNTSIRRVVADNARLPRLDLRLQTQINTLEDGAGLAYRQIDDADYVNYVAGLVFEWPIGNRAAESIYRQRGLERMKATIAYKNTVQQVLFEVKNALRNVETNYRLIEQTRTARVAQTENLRTLLVAKETVQGYTVESLDLELRRQEALAAAEQDEIAALINYNNSIAQMHAATGTSLLRNRIDFVVPTVADWTPDRDH